MRRKKTILVYPASQVEGSAGQTEFSYADEPIAVPCNVRPLDAGEIQFWGDHTSDMRKVFADSWPGDINARLILDGEPWDQVQAEQELDYGNATQHVELVIRRR